MRLLVSINLLWLLTLTLIVLSASKAGKKEHDADVEDDEDEKPVKSSSSSKSSSNTPKEVYKAPKTPPGSFLAETFDGPPSEVYLRWVKSKAKKSGGDRYDGLWGVETPEDAALQGDAALFVKTKARHHAISAKLSSPFDFSFTKQLVIQYEVKFSNGMDCGGAYMKLLSHPFGSLDEFYDKTPFTIMFGPDKCGNDNKLHFIIRFKNPKSGKIEEKFMKRPEGNFDLSKLVTDKKTHLFTLILSADSAFEILVDQKRVKVGSLSSVDDFDPPIVPPAEIDDPKDKKPKDWDDRAKIPDPEAKKPDDWDENEPEFIVDKNEKKPSDWLENEEKMIKDPLAKKPDDWEDDMDGEYEPPLIDNPKCVGVSGCGKWEPIKTKNPKYRGKWTAPMIANPDYKGEWKPRKIPNPDYFEEKDPYAKLTSIAAVGFELWTMSDGIIFDNILVADNRVAAEQFARDTWSVKHRIEAAASQSVVGALLDALQERPWLWIIVVIVVAIPCALLIAYCCFSGTPDRQQQETVAEAARRKKTDSPTADAATGEDDNLIEGEDDDDMPPLESQDQEDPDQEVRQRNDEEQEEDAKKE